MSDYGAAASQTLPTSDGWWCGKSQFLQPSSESTSASRRAQRPLDHGSNLIVDDCSRPTKASLVKQTVAAVFQRSTTPLANGVFVKAELGSHILRQAVRTSQNDAASLR
jgi:hypothetical protein